MTERKKPNIQDDDRALEAFFEAERAEAVEVPAHVLTAVLKDAQQQQPAAKGLAPADPVRTSWLRDVWQALGGWQAAGALSACLLLGVTLGYSPPDSLSTLAENVLISTGISEADSDYYTLDDLVAEG